MTPDRKSAEELVEATRLFVTRHEEALLSSDPRRVLEACDGLHHGLCSTLSAELGRHHNALRAARPAPEAPSPSAGFRDGLRRLREGGAVEREAWAFAVVARRLAESEGALLHLRVTLARHAADGPASLAYARQVAAETWTILRTLAALLGVLESWSDAYGAAAEGLAAPQPRRERTPRDALRAARECLLSGVPEGAAPALSHALAAGLCAPFGPGAEPADLEGALARWRATGQAPPGGEDSIRAVAAELAHGLRDPLVAWRLLDFVDHVVNQASMARPPETLAAGR